MNQNALNHINMVLDAYSGVIEGIFAVKGFSHSKNSYAGKMSIGMTPIEYVDKLRLILQNLPATFQKIGLQEMDNIVFELDNYYLILRKKSKTKAGTPLFLSILTTKEEGLETVETIFEGLFNELFILLR